MSLYQPIYWFKQLTLTGYCWQLLSHKLYQLQHLMPTTSNFLPDSLAIIDRDDTINSVRKY
ncbi:hypothetical protein [Chamaesiphon sp. VAR_48_metabat_403]|uniref:hypothetical protein n=1 Tax=Chamaesiphon sp. VAR_48_metabat_403 TaxID=2964700 RepID=UPI00286E2193|nr:hypothetical protein [Chamaesiphon sp. VAR_48_metabat_403]